MTKKPDLQAVPPVTEQAAPEGEVELRTFDVVLSEIEVGVLANFVHGALARKSRMVFRAPENASPEDLAEVERTKARAETYHEVLEGLAEEFTRMGFGAAIEEALPTPAPTEAAPPAPEAQE